MAPQVIAEDAVIVSGGGEQVWEGGDAAGRQRVEGVTNQEWMSADQREQRINLDRGGQRPAVPLIERVQFGTAEVLERDDRCRVQRPMIHVADAGSRIGVRENHPEIPPSVVSRLEAVPL